MDKKYSSKLTAVIWTYALCVEVNHEHYVTKVSS